LDLRVWGQANFFYRFFYAGLCLKNWEGEVKNEIIKKNFNFLKTKEENYNIIYIGGYKMRHSTNRLTNLQLELIKLFSYNLNEKQLVEIKDLLGKYFAEKATKEMDKVWEEKGLTNDTMNAWLNEHLRSPSN